ncbi:inosine/xanthosine triphosphatase [Spirosomataceae bacterium TFI 002]|nr:inosine/xanthosine triphosphatase [Spirosomataceae bacterium TFI 002]
MKVCIASKNPTKINASKAAFQLVFPDQEIDAIGISSESGVPDQPMGDSETFNGAQNRAKFIRKSNPDADFWIGIEGGLIENEAGEMEAMAWMVVMNKVKTGKARTAGFFIAPKTIALIKQGYELGDADVQTFGVENSKQKMGSSGLLTNNIITRERFYIDAIVLALIPFMNDNLFDEK